MKIRNLAALLIVATGMTCSMPAQTAQPAAAKQKIPATAETRPAIDLSKVPLQEGIHEIYRDKKLGLKIFSVVKDGKVAGYFAVDNKGEVLTSSYNTPACSSGNSMCYGPPTHCVLICLPPRNQ